MGIKEKINRASTLYEQQEFEPAVAILEPIVKKKPKLFDASQLLALVLHKMGKYDEALALLLNVTTRYPRNAESLNHLASLYKDMGQLERAELTFLKALKINNHYSDALNNLANVQRTLGKKIEAEKNYRKAISSDNTQVKYHLNLGLLLGELGQFEQAINSLLKVLELDSSQSTAYFHIFNNFMFMHRYQDALEFADIGLLSNQLNDFQLCELLIGKAILFWLFDNDEEGQRAIALSESINSVKIKHPSLTNHKVFHSFVKDLLQYRQNNRSTYQTSERPLIYFISESHGFAPNGMSVEYQDNEHVIKSLFITGAKLVHFTKELDHRCKASLNILLNGLPEGSSVVLGFGEIDCRVNEGIFKYCSKYVKNYRDVIDGMVEKYISMIKASAASHNFDIIVYGVPAPHPLVLGELNDESKEEFKLLIAYLNKQLAKYCSSNDLSFLDVYQLTNLNGVSNLKYHTDVFHVKPSTVPELFEQLAIKNKIK